MPDFRQPHHGLGSNSDDSGHAVSGAPELKVLIARLADQMASSEARNSAALDQIQSQLAALRQQTLTARRRIPDSVAPAFDRLEDAIADLAAKVGHAHVGHVDGDAQGAAIPSQPIIETRDDASLVSLAEDAEVAPSIAAASQAPSARPADPPALKSAVNAQDASTPAATAEPARTRCETVAAINASLARDPHEPWQTSDAEEITRIYESTAPHLISPAADAGRYGSRRPMATSAVATNLLLTTPTAKLAETDRCWLDGRFSEIADQVSRTLNASDGEVSFQEISRRLDAVEKRFEVMLSEVATRSDMAPVAALERCVAELSDQFDRSQEELTRISLIEQEVLGLADRLSEERLDGIVAAVSTRRPEAPQIDADAIAAIVAMQVAKVLPKAEPKPETASHIAQLRTMVEALATAQQSGGEQTRSTLDTIQEAMIRLLDRMDTIETAQTALHGELSARPPQVAVRPRTPDSVADSTAQREPAPAARQPVRIEVQPAATGPKFVATPPANVRVQMQMTAREPERQPEQVSLPAASTAAPEPKEEPAPANRRDAFVAAARLAAQRASERAKADAARDGSGTDGATASGPHEDEFDLAFRSIDSRRARSDEQDEVRAEDSSSKRLWVAGMALAVLAAGAAGSYAWSVGAPGSPIAHQFDAPDAEARERQAVSASQPAETAPIGDGAALPPHETPSLATDAQPASADVDDGGPREVASNGGFPLGIAVEHTDAEPSAGFLMAYEADRRRAELSTQLGATLPAAIAAPVSLIPSAPAEMTTAPDPSQSPSPSLAPVSRSASPEQMLPPAAIGPSSLRMAAANGVAAAEFEVAARFAEGRGVQQDFRQAATWYERAAKRGYALAQYRIATLYERGLGVGVNRQVALDWYQQSAAQGTVKAMHNLAVLIAGPGGAQGEADYVAAAAWFTRAAEYGLADSQFNLAILYQNGLGVPKDLEQAYQWFGLAARSGDKEAKSQQTALVSSLGAATASRLDKAVSIWRAKQYEPRTNDPTLAAAEWQNQQSS